MIERVVALSEGESWMGTGAGKQEQLVSAAGARDFRG
jgi:hypothetical protein